MYGSKVWHSNSKYRKTIWQCNKKFANAEKCGTPHLTEDIIKNAFMNVFNDMVDNMDAIITFVYATVQTLLKTDSIDRKIDTAKRDTDGKQKALQDYIQSGMRNAIKSDEYNRRVDELAAIYESAKTVQTQHEQAKTLQIERSRKCQVYIDQIKDRECLQEFDKTLFSSIVEKITVFHDKLVFEFKDGHTREYIL